MKRKTTKEILAESFLELPQGKPINKITVSNIVQNCGLTSPTFYRHFKDKYELLSFVYLNEAKNHIRRVGEDGYTWRDAILDGVQVGTRFLKKEAAQ